MPQPLKYVTAAERQRAYRERQKAARAAELQAKGLPPAPAISTMPSSARWAALRQTARAALEAERDERLAYSAERSDAWQESEAAEVFETTLERIDDALAVLDDMDAM